MLNPNPNPTSNQRNPDQEKCYGKRDERATTTCHNFNVRKTMLGQHIYAIRPQEGVITGHLHGAKGEKPTSLEPNPAWETARPYTGWIYPLAHNSTLKQEGPKLTGIIKPETRQ